MEKITQSKAIIIAAVIGAIGAIIAALIIVNKVNTVEVHLIDLETKKSISGKVFIDASNDGSPSYPEKPAVLKIKIGSRVIRAESGDYKTAIVSVKDVVKSRTIEMERIAGTAAVSLVPLSLTGWNIWPSQTLTLTRGAANNESIINSNGMIRNAAGFNRTSLPAAQMRGKTLVLSFANTAASSFSQSRMVKLIYNNGEDDILLHPVNAALIEDEYLTAEDTPDGQGIEFKIPDDFNGEMGFVFYRAELNDLRITAYYK
jgi:hypothetical protein